MKTPLAPGVVPAVLRSIYIGRKTGMLRFIVGEERRSLRFMGGHVVYGEATVPSLHMGEVMFGEGRLPRDVLERAAIVVEKERRRLGAVLVGMGALDERGLEEALALHVRAILVSIFSLREGVYTFQEQDAETFLPDDWPLAISTGQAILAAVEAVARREDVLFALGDLDRVLLPSDDPLVLYQRMELQTVDGFVLSRIDGTLSAREVIDRVPLPEEQVERSLFALLCTGIVQHVAEAARPPERGSPARLREEIEELYDGLGRRSDHELLGVAPEAGPGDVKAAYFRLAKRYHPDVHHAPELADIRQKVETIFFRLHEAYVALTDRQRGMAAVSPAGVGQDGIETMLTHADERLGEGRYWEAIALLEEVVRMGAGRLRTRARVLLGRALLKYPDREKQAERELQAAVQEDPDHVEAHYLLGTLYRRRGLEARAATMLRRVLDLNPRHRAAQAELDALSGEPSQRSRLRKFFGRG